MVHAGQLLAEIETPELDQQLAQARASVAQSHAALQQYQAALVRANANLRLSQVTVARWKRLTEKGVVSKQDGDEKQTVAVGHRRGGARKDRASRTTDAGIEDSHALPRLSKALG